MASIVVNGSVPDGVHGMESGEESVLYPGHPCLDKGSTVVLDGHCSYRGLHSVLHSLLRIHVNGLAWQLRMSQTLQSIKHQEKLERITTNPLKHFMSHKQYETFKQTH